MYRALRCDKIITSMLESILRTYRHYDTSDWMDSSVVDSFLINQVFVTSTIDSADTTNNKRTKINLDGKVNFVKKQR